VGKRLAQAQAGMTDNGTSLQFASNEPYSATYHVTTDDLSTAEAQVRALTGCLRFAERHSTRTAQVLRLQGLLRTASPGIDCDDYNQLSMLVIVGILQRHTMIHEDLHLGRATDEVIQKFGLL
jgi:hypothetical protein